jgi:hypothetical protein
MDYKIIVLLLVLLFIIVLVYREITTIKDQVDKTIMTSTIASKQLNDRHELSMQQNMDKYLCQIKTIGTDNLQQLKKITLLNHQPIIQKKTSNHFTETDGSETNKNQESHYYMSEETKRTNNFYDAEQSPKDDNIPIYDEDTGGNDSKSVESSITCLEEPQQTIQFNDQQLMDTIQTQLNNSINKFDNLFNNGQQIYIHYECGEDVNDSGDNNEDVNVESVSSESINVIKNVETKNIESIEPTNDEPKNDESNETEIETEIIDKNLKDIDYYTLNELKSMAKSLMIPTTYRHQNKTKQYKKEELYNHIKNNYII